MDADPLASYRDMLASMDPKAKADLDRIIRKELNTPWAPDPRNIPQMVAYESKADMLLYGGAAGGGKTDLLCGCAITRHERSVIFRAQYRDLRAIEERLLNIANKGMGRDGYNGQDMILRKPGYMIELGAIGGVGQEMDWQGRPHDFYGFDEGAQLSAEKVNFVTAWLRTTTKGQRTRIIIASNPPIGGEGEWLIEWFAPWLDPMYAHPAVPGELRWAFIGPDAKTVWTDNGNVVRIGSEEYQPLTRTFIPAKLEDNPHLDAKYKAQIQSLPEPLRSKLLKGDFLAGREDHAWQVIPTEWVRKAQSRWKPGGPPGLKMLCLGVDVSGGGNNDPHCLAPLYGNWFDKLTVLQGVDAKDGPALAGQIMVHRKDGALVIIDMTGGWGGSARDHLAANQIEVESCIFNTKSIERTKDDKFRFSNLRAEMLWRLREALDPGSGENIALPPDERLTAELTAARWRPKMDTIQVEDKDEIRHRLGSSPDRADAVMMAWHYRRRAMRSQIVDNDKEAVEIDDPFVLIED